MRALHAVGDRLRRRGSKSGVYVQAVARALRPLEGRGSRGAFLQTLRSVIDIRGRRVRAVDRLYLVDGFLTLFVWGERDNTISLAHGRGAHRPGARAARDPAGMRI